jgi:hypothetical protein
VQVVNEKLAEMDEFKKNRDAEVEQLKKDRDAARTELAKTQLVSGLRVVKEAAKALKRGRIGKEMPKDRRIAKTIGQKPYIKELARLKVK